MQTAPESERNGIWCALARDWVLRLCPQFGSESRIYESTNFLILFPGDIGRGKRYLAFVEQLFARLRAVLGSVALQEWCGKFVVLVASASPSFLDYVSAYHEDGDYMMPGGIYLDHG